MVYVLYNTESRYDTSVNLPGGIMTYNISHKLNIQTKGYKLATNYCIKSTLRELLQIFHRKLQHYNLCTVNIVSVLLYLNEHG